MIQYRPRSEAIDVHELHRQLNHDLKLSAQADNADDLTAEDGRSPVAIEDLSLRLIAMTKELFPPGAVDISLEMDPDEPREEYLVFSVEAEGEFQEILAQEHKWHDEANRLVGETASWLRLCAYPR